MGLGLAGGATAGMAPLEGERRGATAGMAPLEGERFGTEAEGREPAGNSPL